MKVFHILAGAEFGGAETIATDIITALARHGVEQVVATRPFEERLRRLREAGVTVEPYDFSRIQQHTIGRYQVRNLIQRHQPDAVQSWMGRGAAFVPGGIPQPTAGWFGNYYNLKRYKTSDYFVALTRDIQTYLTDNGIPPERTVLLHSFGTLYSDRVQDRAEFDTPAGAPVLLVLARLHWKKGLDTMLHAMEKLPGVYLWIAGTGELEQELKALCTRLGLDDRVRFLGWQHDRKALLDAVDILVVPSRYEPFGTVLTEAWATRTPLVATRADGARQYVTDHDNGLLCEIDDVDGLAACIDECLKDPELAQRLTDNGYRTYEERFSEEAVVKSYVAFYERIIREGSKRS